MNKHNFMNNNPTNNTNNDDCLCSTNQGLFIPNRQLSLLVSAFLFIFFALFSIGYFLGKKYNAEQFMNALKNQKHAPLQEDVATYHGSDQSLQTENSTVPFKHDSVPVDSDAGSSDSYLVSQQLPDQSEKRYYAKLISFGTEKAAKKFAQKLLSRDVIVEVKKHTSKTAKGRIIHWYQVVTLPYTSKNELEIVVNRLIKEETLVGVQIDVC